LTAHQPHETPAPADDLSLHHLLVVLWRGRWMLAATTVLGLLLGFYLAGKKGTVWEVESRLLIERFTPGILDADTWIKGDGGNYVDTQAVLLRSTPVLLAAAGEPSIAINPLLRDQDNKVAWLKRKLDVRVGDADVVTVSLVSELPAAASEIVNAVVDAFREFHADREHSTAEEVLARLNEEKVEREAEFDRQFAAMRAFLEESGTLGLEGGTTNHELTRLAALSTALTQAQVAAIEAQAEWDLAQQLADRPDALRSLIDLPDSVLDEFGAGPGTATTPEGAERAELERRMRELESLRVRLLAERSPEHPTLLALDGELEDLRRRAEALRLEHAADVAERLESQALDPREVDEQEILLQTYLEVLGGRRQLAEAKVEDYRRQMEEQEQKALAIGREQAQYGLLEMQLEQTREVILDLSRRISTINLAHIDEGEKSLLKIEVLDPASVETASSASPRFATISMYLILGVLAGVGLSWLRETYGRRLRTEDDVARLHLPVLSVFPRVRGLKRGAQDVVELWSAQPALAESARSLRTAVLFGVTSPRGRILQVTSPAQGDGKSLTAAQLGIALASAGHRTLVVDADLRAPRQAILFGLDPDPGLSTALAEGGDAARLCRPTSLENLWVLPGGAVPSNPTELLSGGAFDALLARLAADYDWILLDSAPLLGISDSRLIATRSDATLLVLRVDKSTSKLALAARDSLRAVGVHTLGVVLNDMPGSFGYGYGYGQGYGYGAGAGTEPKAVLDPAAPSSKPARSGKGEPLAQEPRP
jgi:capsular exopolysaccharide synthesis family protein